MTWTQTWEQTCPGPVKTVAFGTAADGTLILASAGLDGDVSLWDPVTKRVWRAPLIGHEGEVTSVAFGTLGSGQLILASAGKDGTVRLWTPRVANLTAHPSPTMKVR